MTQRNSAFLNSEVARTWLSQFQQQHQATAAELLQECLLVSRNAFVQRLRMLILERIKKGQVPVGLYVEREVQRQKGKPNRLFKETTTKIKRAFGAGPAPVQSTKAYNPSVGSEGIVAQLVSEICKQHPGVAFDHPGPDIIRLKTVRRFIVVTDFIGSGSRIVNYLNAAWRVSSVRSWRSSKAKTGLRFEVVTYAATTKGTECVQAHPSTPELHMIASCPCISDLPYSRRSALRTLCYEYDPLGKSTDDALGYKGIGALIAFAHGMPNNAPRLLHTSNQSVGKPWAALFPKRVTADSGSTFDKADTDPDQVKERLLKIRQKRLSDADWLSKSKPWFRLQMIVLASLVQPPRTDEAISRKTGFSVLDIQKAIQAAEANQWIGDRRFLTDRGRAELESARKKTAPKTEVPFEPETFYYPKQLRGPS